MGYHIDNQQLNVKQLKTCTMKTKVIMKSVALLAIMFFTLSVSFASPSPRKSSTDLKTILKNSVTYPEFAKENQLSGFVVISFTIDETGKIKISELNTNSLYFQLYVEKKLQEIQIENPGTHKGKTYYYRFDFELLK